MSTAWTSARIVAWWAARSRWYCAKTQQEMYIGSRTSSAATGPYGLRHRTAIISPASPCTQCGASERGSSPRQAVRSGQPLGGGQDAAVEGGEHQAEGERRGRRREQHVREVGERGRAPDPAAAEREPGPPPAARTPAPRPRRRAASWARVPAAARPAGRCSTRPSSAPGSGDERGGGGRQQEDSGEQDGEEGPGAPGTLRPSSGQRVGQFADGVERGERRDGRPRARGAPESRSERSTRQREDGAQDETRAADGIAAPLPSHGLNSYRHTSRMGRIGRPGGSGLIFALRHGTTPRISTFE